jgi:PAS domain S-box-containing protein
MDDTQRRTVGASSPRRAAAEEADALTRATLDSLPAHVAVLGADGTILTVNRAWSAFAAANAGDAATGPGANYFEVCRGAKGALPETTDVGAGLHEVLTGVRDGFVHEYACHGPDGRRWFVLRAARVVGHGEPRLVVQHQEVTAQREAEEAARFRARLLDTVDAAVIALDADGLVTSWNRGAELLYGWAQDEVIGREAGALLRPELTPREADAVLARIQHRGHYEGEVTLQSKTGRRFPAYVRNAVLEGPLGELQGFVGVAVDITVQQRDERALRAAHGYMQAVAASMGEGLCTLDEAGRVVYLNPMAEQLFGWTTAELLGRDLHAVIHHTCADGSPRPEADCALVQGRKDRAAVRLDDEVIVRRDGSWLPVQLIQTPFATEDGVGGFVLVVSDISERKRQRVDADRRLHDLGWIERIRDALDEDRFVLHAQPIVDVGTGETVQHELLIRMLGEDGELVPPGAFLPVAETYGLIGEIDRWVIGQGMAHAAAGRTVELNLSAHSLSDPTLFGFVDAELRRTGADPGLLVFELTETALLRDEAAALRCLTALAERGCGLALDDFGTGYGGFSYLKRLPVDYLKIDIEFVRDLVTEPASRQVVDAVVSLARGFGIRTVAEGVEDAETLALLGARGVDFAQGYHLGRPAAVQSVFDTEEACAR